MKAILLAAMLTVLAAVPARAQSLQYFVIENFLATQPTPPYTFPLNSQVPNALIMFPWSYIEQSNGTFTWTDLDAAITAATVNGGTYSLDIVGGSRAPTWLWSVVDAATEFISCDGTAYANPLNTVVQTKWEAMVDALKAHLTATGAPLPFHLGIIPMNKGLPSVQFSASTSGGTCGTTNDAALWGSCASGPTAGKGCQSGTSSNSNYTIALLETDYQLYGNYVLTDFPTVPILIAPSSAATAFPLVSGQGTSVAQRAAMFTTAGTTWTASQMHAEEDGLNCNNPPGGCTTVFDTALTGFMNTYHVGGVFQTAFPFNAPNQFCTGYGTVNYLCTGNNAGNAGINLNYAFAEVPNSTPYGVGGEVYAQDVNAFAMGKANSAGSMP